MDRKAKLKEYQMPQPVVFWKWVSDTVIALVTQTAVYHWDMEGNFLILS